MPRRNSTNISSYHNKDQWCSVGNRDYAIGLLACKHHKGCVVHDFVRESHQDPFLRKSARHPLIFFMLRDEKALYGKHCGANPSQLRMCSAVVLVLEKRRAATPHCYTWVFTLLSKSSAMRFTTARARCAPRGGVQQPPLPRRVAQRCCRVATCRRQTVLLATRANRGAMWGMPTWPAVAAQSTPCVLEPKLWTVTTSKVVMTLSVVAAAGSGSAAWDPGRVFTRLRTEPLAACTAADWVTPRGRNT